MTQQETMLNTIKTTGRTFKSRKEYRELRRTNQLLPSVSSIEKYFENFGNFQIELDKAKIQYKTNSSEHTPQNIQKWREQVLQERIAIFRNK